jgi:uncharacterized protein (TIGR02147 family)
MIISIYSHTNYKQIVLEWMEHPANKKSSTRKKLAEAMNCQTPFISHVLSGDYHFSLEQTEACAHWMNLSESETNYFMYLVMWARAGTSSLKNHLFQQIKKMREEETVLKKKLKIEDILSPEAQLVYYSSWHYAAIHMALLIPELQTIDALTMHFKLSNKRILQLIDFLIKIGLVRESRGLLKVVKPMIHLEKSSPLLLQHHSQWRLKAIDELQSLSTGSTALNYSGAIALSNDDYSWIKLRLSELLKEISERIKNSKDETVVCLNFDCFEI